MKRISRSFLLLLLSITIIGAFSVTPVLARDNGNDSSHYSMQAFACDYSKNLDQEGVNANPQKYMSMSDSGNHGVTRKPVLYRWDSVRFFHWKEVKMPCAYADVMPDGMKNGMNSGWRDTEEKIRSITFTNLAKGSYAVINVMTWESDG